MDQVVAIDEGPSPSRNAAPWHGVSPCDRPTCQAPGASEDEGLRRRLVGELRLAHGPGAYLQPGLGEAPDDLVGRVPVAGQRHPCSVHLRPVHPLTALSSGPSVAAVSWVPTSCAYTSAVAS